jgi:hypothetical protein
MAVQVRKLHLTDPPRPVRKLAKTSAPADIGDERLDLQAVVAIGAAAISKRAGTCDCGISVVSSRGVHDTLASTSDVPARFDWLQQKLGQGPGMDPAQEDAVLYSPDLAMDERWPDLGATCESVVGVRSLMRIEIPIGGGGRAGMTFYSAKPAAFDPGHMVRAARFARFATRSVQHDAQNRDSSDREAGDGSNRIANALGILMGRYRVASAQAFEMLRDSAETLHVEVLDLAMEVVLSGRLPAERIGNARRDRSTPQVAAAH